MARIQLIIPDEDRDRFSQQARREGMTFSAWLRVAARERLEERQRRARVDSPENLERFFAECDARRGYGVEPDWEEHLQTLRQSVTSGCLELARKPE